MDQPGSPAHDIATNGGGSTRPLDCAKPQAAALHASLLSPSQYDHTVLDLLQVNGDPAKSFGGGAATQLDDLGVERRANAAADVAKSAVASMAQWAPCIPPMVDPATCEGLILDKLGTAAFRHRVAADERAQLKVLFDAGVTEKDFATGVEWLITGLLQAPDFLYNFVRPTTDEKAGEVRPLSGYEIASRLSYFVWDSTPDDALLASAEAGQLGDALHIGTAVGRMIQDPRFMRGVTGFYSTWLKVEGFAEVARDDAGFTTDIVNALQASLLLSATSIYQTPSPNLSTLLSGQSYFLNPALRTFYGISGTSTDFGATEMPGEDRHGILTHPGLMALLARPSATNPIARGLLMRRTIMCDDIPPPPAGIVIPPLPPVMPGLSTRDRLDSHASVALCATCHSQIDPPGYAFENFDQVGRHRTMDSGKPVDTSVDLTRGGDLEGKYPNGGAFLEKVSASQDIRRCFAKQYFEYAMARAAVDQDQCSIDALGKQFAPSGDLKGLVASIVDTDSFRLRRSEGAPQ
jgi:hypothetical protein